MRLSLAIMVAVIAVVSYGSATWFQPSVAEPRQVAVSIDPASLMLNATELPVQQYPAF